jgi:hypothetical protein
VAVRRREGIWKPVLLLPLASHLVQEGVQLLRHHDPLVRLRFFVLCTVLWMWLDGHYFAGSGSASKSKAKLLYTS